MLKKLLIIILTDFIVLIPFTASTDPQPSSTLGIIFIIPFLALINIVAGFILSSLSTVNKNLAAAMFINALIAPIIFYSIFSYTIDSNERSAYKHYYFKNNNRNYSLDIKLNNGEFADSLRFEIYEIAKVSSGSTGLNGRYTVNRDTLILVTDSGRQMKAFDMLLYNFPGAAKIKMTTKKPSF